MTVDRSIRCAVLLAVCLLTASLLAGPAAALASATAEGTSSFTLTAVDSGLTVTFAPVTPGDATSSSGSGSAFTGGDLFDPPPGASPAVVDEPFTMTSIAGAMAPTPPGTAAATRMNNIRVGLARDEGVSGDLTATFDFEFDWALGASVSDPLLEDAFASAFFGISGDEPLPATFDGTPGDSFEVNPTIGPADLSDTDGDSVAMTITLDDSVSGLFFDVITDATAGAESNRPAVVPEPATTSLVLIGGAVLLGRRKRRRRG